MKFRNLTYFSVPKVRPDSATSSSISSESRSFGNEICKLTLKFKEQVVIR